MQASTQLNALLGDPVLDPFAAVRVERGGKAGRPDYRESPTLAVLADCRRAGGTASS